MKTFKMFAVLLSSVILGNKIYFDLTSVIIRDYEVFRATRSLWIKVVFFHKDQLALFLFK